MKPIPVEKKGGGTHQGEMRELVLPCELVALNEERKEIKLRLVHPDVVLRQVLQHGLVGEGLVGLFQPWVSFKKLVPICL